MLKMAQEEQNNAEAGEGSPPQDQKSSKRTGGPRPRRAPRDHRQGHRQASQGTRRHTSHDGMDWEQIMQSDEMAFFKEKMSEFIVEVLTETGSGPTPEQIRAKGREIIELARQQRSR